MEFGSINVVPERSCFVKSDIANIQLRSFDYIKQTKLTTSFISYVQNCYEIMDEQLLLKIVPEKFSDIYQQDIIIKEIVSFFKIYGIQIDSSPHPTDHFSAVQNSIYKNNNSNIVYSREDFINDCQNDDDEDLNFTSKNVFKYLNIISMRMQKPIIALYYTPIGFFKLSSQSLDTETICNSYFFIILGQDTCFTPEFVQFNLIHPQESYGMRKAGLSFFPIIRFELINGIFQPIFSDHSFAHFTTNCTGFPTRTDSLSFPYESILGRSTILVGLIGVYSTIVKYLSHDAVKINLVESFDDTSPFIGMYISKTANVYIFLFIPNGLPPSHPLYRDVTVYATSLMQRICTRTFFLSEDDNNDSKLTVKSDFHIGNLSKLYGNRVLGSFDSSLILHCDPANFVGSAGKDFIQLNSCDEFLMWKKYISRRFQINPIKSEKVHTNSLPFNQLIQLISDHDYNSNKSRMEKIINGNKNSQFNEIDEQIKQSYSKYIKNKNDENKANLLSICNQKMDQFTLLFNQASLWMKASSFVLSNHCQFCNLPCNEKPEQDSPLWSSVCFRCKLEKTQNFNKSTRGSKRSTQFLEEKVEEIEQNEKESEFFHKIFRDYLLNNKAVDISNQNFTKWLFEYWTIQSLNNGIELIKTTNDIEINEDVKNSYKAHQKDDDFSLFNFIIKLTGNSLEGVEYYSILPAIFLQVPFEKDSDSIRDLYLNYYVETIVPVLCKPPEMSPYMFFERCQEEVEKMTKSGFVDDSIVEVSNISSTTEGGNTIEVEFKWKEKNSERNVQSFNYTFYSISDISLLNSSFASKPVNCTSVVSLSSQPISLFIANSFYLSKFNRTIIVSILGQSLWINVLKDGFNSTFLPDPVFSLEVEKDSGRFTYCSFASLANLIVLFVKSKSGDFYFYSIQISRDFKSSNIVAHRSFQQIAPLSSRQIFSSKMYGFTISNDASVGVFCSDYFYDDNDNQQFAMIKFDPWSLIAKQREDSFDSPFNPIFIVSSLSSKFSYDLICHCEGESSLNPTNSRIFRLPLDGKRLDEVFGVVLWRGEPRIVKLNEMNEPVFELPESFRIETELSFLPADSVSILTDSIDKYGVSEADRISANGHYPIDSVTVDSFFDIQNHQKLVDSYFEAGKEAASNGIEFHLNAHQNPVAMSLKNGVSCSIMDIDIRPKEKNDPKKSFFPFFHRLTALPRFLIRSPIEPKIYYPHGCTTSVLEQSFIERKASFPPLPLLRELIRRGKVESRTFSVINGSSSFCSSNVLNSATINNGFSCSVSSCSDGKDTEILSAYTGLQFVNTPPGSVRLGSCIVPTEFNKLRKFDKFYLLNALSFSPFDLNSAIHCALALLHAIYCSGAVAFVTRRKIDFVVKVFQMMRDSIPTIENSAQHLNFSFSNTNSNDDEDDENNNLNFEPAQFIVVVCDLGKQYEREAEKLRNEVSSLLNGFAPGDICYDILSKNIVAIPIDLSSQEIAKIIADNVLLPSVDLEESTGRILDFVASFGSFIDNTYLFKFD